VRMLTQGSRCLVSRLGVRQYSTIHQFQAALIDGTKISLSRYAGKAVLIENTATL